MKYLWTLAVLTLVFLHFSNQGPSEVFYGVAESVELKISNESSTEVLKFYVEPGEQISVGDTLVQLHSSDLTIKIEELHRKKNALLGETSLSHSDILKQQSVLKNSWYQKENSLQYQIQQLKNQFKKNSELNRSLFPEKVQNVTDSSFGILLKIKGFNKQLLSEKANFNRLNQLLSGSSGLQKNSGKEQLVQIEKELDLLQQQKNKLLIKATQAGIISKLWVKPGQATAPYIPIISITAHRPTQVLGYLHENSFHKINSNDSVRVISKASSKSVLGKVVGMGTRIIEFPERLRKHPDLLVWGREVNISIPKTNPFLLGEKVRLEVLQ